jgi:hypothetical protein
MLMYSGSSGGGDVGWMEEEEDLEGSRVLVWWGFGWTKALRI